MANLTDKIISGGERRLRCLRQLVTANNNNLDSKNGGSLARLSAMRQGLLAGKNHFDDVLTSRLF